VVWLWWITDIVTFKLPWEKLLGVDADPTEIYKLIMIFRHNLQTYLGQNQEQNKFKIIGVSLTVAVIGYFVNGTLLFFVTLLGVLALPGFLNIRLKKQREMEKKNS